MSSDILLLGREIEPFHYSKNIYNSQQILKRRFPVQAPLGAPTCSGTQPCHKALGDLKVEIVD